jgi:hypothetical protein
LILGVEFEIIWGAASFDASLIGSDLSRQGKPAWIDLLEERLKV